MDQGLNDNPEQLRMAAEQGDPGSQYLLGVKYFKGDGISPSPSEAARWFRMAAEQGNADAQASMGYMHDNGEGVPKNKAEAARWYRLAAEKGHLVAQASLGRMLRLGQGVPKNTYEAIKWLRKAAAKGHPDAQYNLSEVLSAGEGVTKNESEGYEWLCKSVKQGHPMAQVALGMHNYLGYGVPQNRTAASNLFRLGTERCRVLAEKGNVDAQLVMGTLFYIVDEFKDDAKATKWLRLAAGQGSADAQGLLDELNQSQSESAGYAAMESSVALARTAEWTAPPMSVFSQDARQSPAGQSDGTALMCPHCRSTNVRKVMLYGGKRNWPAVIVVGIVLGLASFGTLAFLASLLHYTGSFKYKCNKCDGTWQD